MRRAEGPGPFPGRRAIRRPSRWLRAALVFLAAITAATCTDNPSGPGRGAPGYLAVRPRFASPINLAAFGLSLDSVSVIVVRPATDTLADTTVAMSPDSNALRLAIELNLLQPVETLSVSIQLKSGSLVLFSGTQDVAVHQGAPDSSATPTIPLSYVGPGNNVAAISVAPQDSVIRFSDSLRFRVTATDSSSNPVTSFFVSWTTSDTTLLRVNAFGVARAPSARRTVWVIAHTPTNVVDSTPVTVIPVPNAVVKVSGDLQTRSVGAPLALPLRVRVTAADALGVKGIPIQFQVTNGTATLGRALVVTDSGGYAEDSVRLGGTLGAVAISATAPALASVGFSETAIAGAPASIAVNGGNGQSAVAGLAVAAAPSVVVRDSFANPVAGATVTFSVVSGGGSVTGATPATNASGIAAVGSWALGTVAGPDTLRAATGGLSVLFTATGIAGPASAAASVVSASAGTVTSGAAVTLTLQAKDANGNAITTGGLTVLFNRSGGSSTGTIGATTDHGNGTYTATFTGVLAGTATTIGATIGGTAVTSLLPTISVTPGVASVATSLVTVSGGGTLASGAVDTVTLHAKDAAGNPLATGGSTVLFSVSGGSSTGTLSAVTDHGDGTYTATFTGVLAGTAVNVGATIGGAAVTTALPSLTVVPGPASVATSTVSVGTGTIPSGTGTLVTLHARDAAGNSLTAGGLTVLFSASGGTSTGAFGTVTDNANGTYTATFTGAVAGTATTIGATIGGTAVATALPTVTVTAGAVSTATSVLQASAATIASGGTVTLTLQAKDAAGNNLAAGGLTVVFNHSGGSSSGPVSGTTDNGNGTYSATFTAVGAGTATVVGATINGTAVTSAAPTITVTPGAASLATSLVTVSSGSVLSGSAVTLTLQARDAAGNSLTAGGLTVAFTAAGGTSTGTIGATTDHLNGTYTASFTGVLAGTATTIGAQIGGSAVTSALPAVSVTPGAVSLATSLVTVSAGSVLSGNAVTLTLQAKDAAGNDETAGGLTVAFTSSGGTSTGTIGATTDHANGTYTASFTGVLVGTPATIGATIGGSAVTSALPTVSVTAGAASVATSVVTVGSGSIVSGSGTTVTLRTKDAAGNPLAAGGASVAFTATGGASTGIFGSVTDNGDGTYSATFTGVLAGSATSIGATIGGAAVTTALPTIAVTPGSASLSTSVVTVSSGTLASGSVATLTLQAKDAAGNNLTAGGLTVVFGISGGTSTGTIGAVVDHANGTYTAPFTGVVAGTAVTVGATIAGSAVTSALPTITVVPSSNVAAQSLVSVSAGTVLSGGTVTLTLQAKDSAGNNITVGGFTVVFTASGGASTGTIGSTTDHGNGAYTATFTGVLAGTATTIGATINGAPVTSTLPTVSVTPGAASVATSLVTVSSGTVLSGGGVTLTLRAKDAAGNNLTAGGLTVVFTASGGTSTGTIGSTTDHGDGTYTATFTGVTVGTPTTIGANINGSPVTSALPTITVNAGSVSLATSLVTVGSGSVVSGAGTTLTLQAKDAAGNNLSSGGLTVVFTMSGGTSTGTIGSTTDHGNGTYTASFTGVLAGTAITIGATIGGSAVTSVLPTISVTAGAISVATSVVSVANATDSSGKAETLTLTAKDAAGNPLAGGGATVVFTATGGTSTGTIGSTTDHGNGAYTALFTGVLAGTATTIGATINAGAVTSALPTISVVPGAVSAAQSLVVVSSASVASGLLDTLTLVSKDAAGNFITTGGDSVTFTRFGGTSTGTIAPLAPAPAIDNGNGTYTAIFTALVAGTPTTIHAQLGAISVTSTLPTITVTVGAISAAKSVITVSDSTVAGGGTDTLKLQAKDGAGNLITTGGAAVVFTASGGTSTGAIGATTDHGDGTYSAIFTGLTAGTPTAIHATIGLNSVTTALPTIRVTTTAQLTDITTNTTWTAAASPYVVGAYVRIRNGATLTVQPGATVLFDSAAGLQVGDSGLAETGALSMNSTTTPILLTSHGTQAPGFWRGIEVQNGLGSTTWGNVRIEFAGGVRPLADSLAEGCVYVNDQARRTITMNGVTLRQCRRDGLHLLRGTVAYRQGAVDTTSAMGIRADGDSATLQLDTTTVAGAGAAGLLVSGLQSGFSAAGNLFRGNAGHPVNLSGRALPGLGAETYDTTAGGIPSVFVSSGGIMSGDVRIQGTGQAVPFVVADSAVLIQGGAGTFFLEPNAVMKFGRGSALVIGQVAGTESGNIVSLGTDTTDAPLLTSAQAFPAGGDWTGLEIGRLARNDTLRVVKIHFAGDSTPGRTQRRFGLKVRNATNALTVDSVFVRAAARPADSATAAGFGVSAAAAGVDIRRSLAENTQGDGFLVTVRGAKLVGDSARANSANGIHVLIGSSVQLSAQDSIADNALVGNHAYPLRIGAGAIQGLFRQRSISSNVLDTLLVDSTGSVTDSATLGFSGRPWRVMNRIVVDSGAVLSLAGGDSVFFDSTAALIVGDSTGLTAGVLRALAPSDSGILLTATNPASPWGGIRFDNVAGTLLADTLRNVTVDRAGSFQCAPRVIFGTSRRPARTAPKRPTRDQIFCNGTLSTFGAIHFVNQSPASLVLDSVTIRGAVTTALQAEPTGGGSVYVTQGQFYGNTFSPVFLANDGLALTIDSSDINHYGRYYYDLVVENHGANPVSTDDVWWGDVAGPGSIPSSRPYASYADSIGRAILVQGLDTVTVSAPAAQPHFPTGAAATVIATPDSLVPTVTAGVPLVDSIRARAVDAQGRGTGGATVTWGTGSGSGAVTFVTNISDAGGRAGGMWVPPTAAKLDTAFAGLGAPSARYLLNVLAGFASTEHFTLATALTQGVVAADSMSAAFTSTGRHGVLVTHARDLYGNVATPSCSQSPSCFYFDDVPGAGFSHGYGTIDSVKADSVFFSVSSGFPQTFQIHATYPIDTLGSTIADSVILTVNQIGVAVQIWGFFGYAPTDSATFNSICPSTGPFNFFCQKTVYAYVVDSAGAPLQINPGYFPQWQTLVPGDTTVGIDPNFQFNFSPPVNAQANGATAIVVNVSADGPPSLAIPSDTLYLTVNQVEGQVGVTSARGSPTLDTLSAGIGDTVTLYGFLADSGGFPMGSQGPIGWRIDPPFDTHLAVIDSGADSLSVRLDSGVWTYNGYLTSWVDVVHAYSVVMPTITGQGTLYNPIHYEGAGVGGGPVHALVDPLNHWVGVINQTGNSVTLTNTATNVRLGPVLTGNSPIWGAVDPSRNRMYVANDVDGTVSVIGEPDTIVATVPVGGPVYGMAVDSATHRAFVAVRLCPGGPPFCSTRSYIVPIDGTSDTVMIADTIPLGTDTVFAPQGLAWNRGNGRLYVGRSDGVLQVVDVAALSVVDSVVLASGYAINDVAVNDSTNMVYATSTYGQHFFVIDGTTLVFSEPFPTNTPGGVSVDVHHNRVYFGSIGNNTVTVVDGANPTNDPYVVVGTSYPDFPTDAAVDQNTGTVYAPHAFGLAMLQFYGKRGPLPTGAPRIRTTTQLPRSLAPMVRPAASPARAPRAPFPAGPAKLPRRQ